MTAKMHRQTLSTEEPTVFTAPGEVRSLATVEIDSDGVPVLLSLVYEAYSPAGKPEVSVFAVGPGGVCPHRPWAYIATTESAGTVHHWYGRRRYVA